MKEQLVVKFRGSRKEHLFPVLNPRAALNSIQGADHDKFISFLGQDGDGLFLTLQVEEIAGAWIETEENE